MEKRIIYKNEKGGISVIIPAECGMSIEDIAAKDVPNGTEYKIVDLSEIPEDRIFRNAWELSEEKVSVNLEKSKTIAHEIRRYLREEEFKPLDELIMKKIPTVDADIVEANRQLIRDKYAIMQINIDSANSAEDVGYIIKENMT